MAFEHPARKRRSCRVLLVEDDEATGMFAARHLARSGYCVAGPFGTEEAALKQAAFERPDLVLTDIELAEGGDGVRLAESLFVRWGIPTLLVSGSPHEAERGGAIALGFLGKPYKLTTLSDCVSYFHCWLLRRPVCSSPAELRLFPAAEPYRNRT